jgi:glycosyltransferase involved in cell wall biosynthesis
MASPTLCEDLPSPTLPRTRVLHVINGEVYGGAERALDHLAQHLGRFGFDVVMACLKPGLFPKVRHCRSVPLVEVPMRSRFDLRPVRALVEMVRSGGFQLLYAHTARSALVASLVSRITGVPLVYHVQSPTSRDTTRRWRNWINSLVERFSLRRARALVAVSKSLAEDLRRQGYAATRVAVVHNGSPCREGFKGDSPVFVERKLGQSPERKLGQSPNGRSEWVLGMTALIRPRKGIEVALRALAALREQGLPVRFRVVGPFDTPAYEQEVKALACRLGLQEAVDWVGFTRDVDGELARMDLFVLPSLFGEGTPLVLFEAMAAGVPVVSTRVEGIPEIVRDGRDGLLVEPGDPAALAAAIARIIRGEADWHAMRESALARHRENFSDTALAAGIAAVYRRVLSGGSPRAGQAPA